MSYSIEQEQVIKSTNGSLVVLAGPGSGKTHTTIEKILYLFNNDLVSDPFGVLAITFTNAAANEMRFRLQTKGFHFWDRIFVGTYHSFGGYLLSSYGSDIGIREDFKVIDPEEQTNILTEIMLKHPGIQIASVKTAIERLKRQGIYPGVNDKEMSSDFREIYSEYQNKLLERNFVDYGDLIAYPIKLLETSPLAFRIFTNHYRYLVVDEFQDTDAQQMKLVEIMAQKADGVTVVADDDQSIFGWRGANRKNVKNITDKLNAQVCVLGTNFRSDQVIVEAANKLIQSEPNRFDKNIQSASKNSGKLFYENFPDEKSESEAIAQQINHLRVSGQIQDFGEVALIARARWRSKSILEIFDKSGISWFDRSKLSFDDSWDALLAIAILELSIHIDSSDGLYNIMSVVESSGLAFQLSAADALDVAVNIRNCLKSNLNCEAVPENAREILAAANFEQLVESASWSVTETGNRIANSNHLLNDITNVSSQSNLNLKEAISRLAGRGAVQVLTGQESKGREFNQVFLIGLEEGLIPDKRANTEETLAEERRIFYVALTRAKSAAYLSSLAQRNTPWNTTQKITPSRFLKSIPPELINQFPNK